MKLKRRWMTRVVVVPFILTSVAANADGARPLRFVCVAADTANNATTGGVFTGPFVVSTPLAGWHCQTSAIETKTLAASVIGPASVYQVASVKCSSASGSVELLASCKLTSADVSDVNLATLSDSSGHKARISMACTNGN